MRIRLESIVTVACLLVVVALFIVPGWLRPGTVQLLTFILVAIVLAQSINVLTGLAGEISLGHAGLFGTGAYVSGVLAKGGMVDPLSAIALGALGAGAVGLMLSYPAGRVREVYLAMMTLGFGMVFYELIREWQDVTGGVMGLSGVPSVVLRNLTLFGVRVDAGNYLRFVLVVTLVLLLILRNVSQSRLGRAMVAVQANAVAAASLGISPAATKRLAYGISGAVAGLAGALYAHLVGYLGPDSFGLGRSIEVLVISIVGGLGSIAGQVLSAIAFTILPERLQAFAEYQFIVYGLILACTLVVMPKGIAGLLLPAPRFIRAGSRRRAEVAAAAGGPAGGDTPWHRDRAAQAPAALRVEGVVVRFGGLVAIDDVSLEIPAGRITGLIGPNGSGKSTLVNVISGVVRCTSGSVRFGPRVISGLRDVQIARLGLIRTFQDPRLVPSFTVRENLLLGRTRLWRHSGMAAALGLPSASDDEAAALRAADIVLQQAGLTDVADRAVETLPYGSMRLAELGRAIMACPDALLLDEPAAGLSEPEVARLSEIIRWLRSSGVTILLIDHHMDFIAGLVDGVFVLDSGRVIFSGAVADMRKDAGVVTAYLGSEELAHA
jgi:branched-chain amino acid transport system permease protein